MEMSPQMEAFVGSGLQIVVSAASVSGFCLFSFGVVGVCVSSLGCVGLGCERLT